MNSSRLGWSLAALGLGGLAGIGPLIDITQRESPDDAASCEQLGLSPLFGATALESLRQEG